MPIKVVVSPTGEQITLTEARLHLRLDDDGDSPAAHPDDAWLTGVGIPAAREYCEGWLGRALVPQTLEVGLDSFTAPFDATFIGSVSGCSRSWRWPRVDFNVINLPMLPITSISSVKYYNASGDQTFTGYHFDDYEGRIVLIDGTSWPTTTVRPNAVRIRYRAGYDLPGDSPNTNPLPYAIKAAMLLVLGSLYEQREDSAEKKLEPIPLGAQSLMMPYRVRLAMA